MINLHTTYAKPSYLLTIEVFVSSSILFATIFQAIVVIGWSLLQFAHKDAHCNASPGVSYYVHTLGWISFGGLITLWILYVVSEDYPLTYPHKEGDDISTNEGTIRPQSDRPDAPAITITSAVSSSMLRQRLQTISGIVDNQDRFPRHIGQVGPVNEHPVPQEPTAKSLLVEATFLRMVYLIFLFMHLGTLIFGTVVVVPLFFSYDLHLGNVLDSTTICYQPLFWFAFLILLTEYLMITVFTICFAMEGVPKTMDSFHKDLTGNARPRRRHRDRM